MKIDNELKNFWNDKERVKKAEEQLLKKEKRKETFINENYFSKDEKEPIFNINNLEKKKSNILGLFILTLLIICSIFVTYLIYSIISERNEQNKNFIMKP